jgi:hypothetical protein
LIILALVAMASPSALIPFASGQAQSAATKTDAGGQPESIDVRYARAHLALTEFDLNQALLRNKQTPNLISPTTLAILRRHVAVAREELQQFLRGSGADMHEIFLRNAEAAMENAGAALETQRKLQQLSPGPTNNAALERAELVAKLTSLNFERTRDRKISESDVYSMRWQIEDLQNQVLVLQDQLIDLQQTGQRKR